MSKKKDVADWLKQIQKQHPERHAQYPRLLGSHSDRLSPEVKLKLANGEAPLSKESPKTTIVKQDMSNSAFCVFEEWAVHLPESLRGLPESYWLAKARAGTWAGFLRPLGQRSTPHYRRTDIAAHFRVAFSVLYPAALKSLLAANFSLPVAPEPLIKRMKKKPGRKATVRNA